MTVQKEGDKHMRRDGRKLWEHARHAFDSGDYHQYDTLTHEVIAVAPGSDVAQEAAVAVKRMHPDRLAWWVVLFSLGIYLLVWFLVL